MQSVGLQAPWVSYDFRVNSHAVFTSSSFTHTQTVVNTATATRPFRSTLDCTWRTEGMLGTFGYTRSANVIIVRPALTRNFKT